MRQGQQNRRGRGRGSNNANTGGGGGGSSSNRKGQNPLSRTYESSGPDVKIRGTAVQIAEKYTTLARDASSSGDVIMAENYLQHAEHYNRIIMAAQAQSALQPVHNGSDASHVMNGAQRPQRDVNGAAMRDQPQPHIGEPGPSDEQPQPEVAAAPASAAVSDQPYPDVQPVVEKPAKAPKAEAAKVDAADDAANGDADAGRRRRRRYPGSNGTGRAAAAAAGTDGANGSKTAAAPGEEQPTDEATA